jgi:hypothetical protein
MGESYSVSWQSEAGTVYGGTLDVTTGELTVDMATGTWPASSAPTISSITTRDSDNTTCFWMVMSYLGLSVVNSGNKSLCDKLSYGGSNIASLNAFQFGANISYPISAFIRMPTDLIGTTAESILEYFNAHPVTFYAALTNPLTYQLTPTEVKTLLGLNNIWADTGDTSVTYRADPTLFINGKVAALTALMSES